MRNQIRERIRKEQEVLNNQWVVKRSGGMLKYILNGMVRCFIFLGIAMILYCIIDKKDDIVHFLTVDLIASIIIPVLSWYGNELR